MKSKALHILVRIIKLNKAKNLYEVMSNTVGVPKATLEYALKAAAQKLGDGGSLE